MSFVKSFAMLFHTVPNFCSMKLESDPSIVLGLVSAATVSSFSVLGFSEKHFVSPFID